MPSISITYSPTWIFQRDFRFSLGGFGLISALNYQLQKNLPILESGLSSSVFWIRKISKKSTLIALDLNVLQISIERKSIMGEAGGACEYMGRDSQISKLELWLMK